MPAAAEIKLATLTEYTTGILICAVVNNVDHFYAVQRTSQELRMRSLVTFNGRDIRMLVSIVRYAFSVSLKVSQTFLPLTT